MSREIDQMLNRQKITSMDTEENDYASGRKK